jgi:hypothetical protein
MAHNQQAAYQQVQQMAYNQQAAHQQVQQIKQISQHHQEQMEEDDISRPPRSRSMEDVEVEETEGTTSLSSILGEKSLFDYQNDTTRQMGTESRSSDHSESVLQSSKRNSINQRVRAMSSDRVIKTQPTKEKFDLEIIDEDEDSSVHSGNMVPEIKDKKKTSQVMDRAKEMAKLREL